MVIFLYGQDTYRSRQKLKEIINQYKKTHPSGLSLIFFEGEDFQFSDFKEAFRQVSMFGEKKLLILKNVFKNEDFKEKFVASFKARSDIKEKEILLFFQEGEVPAKDKLFNFLKTKAKSEKFEPLKGEKLKSWAENEFLKLGKRISRSALDKLVQSTGNDLWRLSNEIKKLGFLSGEKEIGIKEVDLLVKPEVETAIFKTIDAISQKDKKGALLLLHQHLEKGDHPLYLLSMINFQFRNILVIKDLIKKNRPYYSILKETKLHPFVVKKSYQQAYKFTFQELKKIYQKIFEVDLNIKTGRIEPETALDLLIAGI